MMRYASLALLATVAGCPESSHDNPAVLWLAPFMSETRVQLVESEPSPY